MKRIIFWIIIFVILALLCFSNDERLFFPTSRGRLMDTLIFHNEDNLWKAMADVCTPTSQTSPEANSDLKYTSEQEFLFGTIRQRRTVREFQSTPVPKEHILKILDVARFAPTAGNQQPWRFLVIQDREKLNRLEREACLWYLERYKSLKSPEPKELESIQQKIQETLENVLSATVYVAVLVNSREKYPEYIVIDGTLAAGTLMIAARALGYGTGFYTSFFPEDKMKKFFNIPDNFKLICFTPIGVPKKWPETPAKKKLEDLVIFESF
jgi:nitroreductase